MGSGQTLREGAGFSLDEMKAVAAEVGLDPEAIERAARLLPVGEERSLLARVFGGPVRQQLDSHFPSPLTAESAAHLLAVIRATAMKQGEGDASGGGVAWHSTGEGTQFFVNVHAEGDGTRVKVSANRGGTVAITSMLTGFGTIMAAIAALGIIETAEPSAAISYLLFGGAISGGLAIGRTAWALTAKRVRAKLNGLMDSIGSAMGSVPLPHALRDGADASAGDGADSPAGNGADSPAGDAADGPS